MLPFVPKTLEFSKSAGAKNVYNLFGGYNIIEADTPGYLRSLQDPSDPISLQSYHVSGSEDPSDPPLSLSIQ